MITSWQRDRAVRGGVVSLVAVKGADLDPGRGSWRIADGPSWLMMGRPNSILTCKSARGERDSKVGAKVWS